MYRVSVKEKPGRGIWQAKQPRKFPGRKAGKVLYFASWESACELCVKAGLRVKQITIV